MRAPSTKTLPSSADAGILRRQARGARKLGLVLWRRYPANLAHVVAIALFAVIVSRFRFVSDDAYILFRYARNLAEGHGLRYNLSRPPVEGYSEFLWAVWVALLERLGFDAPLWATISSTICAFTLIACVIVFVRSRMRGSPLATLATGLCIGSLPPLAVWSTGGLATAPFALALFCAYERLLGDPHRPRALQAGVCLVAAGLLRADGALFAGLILAVTFASSWLPAVRVRPADAQRLRVAALQAGLVVACGISLHLAWRYSFYGDLLPQTARAKAVFGAQALERGWRYVAIFGLTFPAVALAPILGVLVASSRHRAHVLQALVLIAGTVAYCVAVSGDFMAMGRFLVPALPFAVVAVAAIVMRIEQLPRGPALAAAATVVVVAVSIAPAFDLHVVPASVRERFHFRWNSDVYESEYATWRRMKENSERWADLGRALGAVSREGESVVANAIGAVGYYSNITVYDTFGLVTPEVARVEARLRSPGHDRKAPMRLFAKYRPTYLQARLLDAEHAQPEPRAPIPLLGQKYRREVVPVPPESGLDPGARLLLLRLLEPAEDAGAGRGR